MEPEVRRYFKDRLEQTKQDFLEGVKSLADEMFQQILNEFDRLAESELTSPGQPRTAYPPVGNCIDEMRNKIQNLLLTTYQELFQVYEQSIDCCQSIDTCVDGYEIDTVTAGTTVLTSTTIVGLQQPVKVADDVDMMKAARESDHHQQLQQDHLILHSANEQELQQLKHVEEQQSIDFQVVEFEFTKVKRRKRKLSLVPNEKA